MAVDRREEILSAAAELFATQGYHQTTVSDIAKAAKVAQGTVYLYFDSKKSVFAALVDQTLELFHKALSYGTRMRTSMSPDEFVRQMPKVYEHVLNLFLDHPTMVRLMLTEVRGADPEIEAKLNAFYEEVVSETARHLELGAKDGLFRRDLDFRLVAQCLVAIMERFAALSLAEERHDIASMAESIARFTLFGLLAD